MEITIDSDDVRVQTKGSLGENRRACGGCGAELRNEWGDIERHSVFDCLKHLRAEIDKLKKRQTETP